VGCLTRRCPFRRNEVPNRFQTPVAEYLVASREVGCSAESYDRRSNEPIGLLAPTMSSPFPTTRWFFPGGVPQSLSRLGSSSRELRSLFRVRPVCHLPDTRMPCTSQGLPPIRDSSIRSPPIGGLPSPTFVSPSAFLTLSTSYSSKYLVGLFHPTATSGIHSSGVFPAAKPPCLSTSRPLMPFLEFAYQ
jgi:hypothetical protein